MVPKWLQNGSQNGPRKAARGSPKATWGPCIVLRAPAQSFFLLLFWLCSCLCFWFWFWLFVCVLLLFVRSLVLYVFMCACFFVVCFVSCCCVFVLCLRLRDVRRVPCSFWGHLKETCNMFQDVSEWFTGDADSFGMRWVCASRDGSLIGGLES